MHLNQTVNAARQGDVADQREGNARSFSTRLKQAAGVTVILSDRDGWLLLQFTSFEHPFVRQVHVKKVQWA